MMTDVSNEKRDNDGKWTKGGAGAKQSSNGNQSAQGSKDTTKEKVPSAKALAAKKSHSPTNANVQRYAEEHNEPRIAKMLGGKSQSYPDSEPLDVQWRDKEGKPLGNCEIKTMVSNTRGSITMDSYSQVRKAIYEKESGVPFHTIVSDDRQVFEAHGNPDPKLNPGDQGYADIHDESKRVYYYRRGIAGSAKIDGMYKCKDEAELKRVMALPDEELPEGAGRVDQHLFVGQWKATIVDGRKAFKNRKTGKIIKAKE
jgi:hypothetical protein